MKVLDPQGYQHTTCCLGVCKVRRPHRLEVHPRHHRLQEELRLHPLPVVLRGTIGKQR